MNKTVICPECRTIVFNYHDKSIGGQFPSAQQYMLCLKCLFKYTMKFNEKAKEDINK